MTKFFYAEPLRKPEDVKPYLGDPARHWRPGYSAAELAMSWIGANDIPEPVRTVLNTSDISIGPRRRYSRLNGTAPGTR